MKKQKTAFHFDLGLFLLSTGALANITIWIGAFVATEADGPVGAWVRSILLPILGGISGLAMGITVAVGLVYVLARLGKMKPTTEHKVRGKKRYRVVPNVRYYTAWSAIGLLLIISPALLAPYVFMIISGTSSLYLVLGDWWARIWSVGRVVAADLAMGAVALVHGVQLGALAGAGRPARTPVHSSHSEPGATHSDRNPSDTPKKEPQSATEMRECEVPSCGMSYRWPQGKGAHFKKYHPDLVIQKGIPAKVSLPINDTTKAEKK